MSVSPMWRYIQCLRWPLIHGRTPGMLSALCEGGAATLDETLTAMRWLRDQFSPDKCERQYLGRHADSRGLRRLHSESDDMWRTRVSRAMAFHRLGGRRAGIEQILSMLGISVQIIEPGDQVANMSRLDGSLQLDGTWRLARAILNNLQWAEFGVRCNVATAVDSNWYEQVRDVVYEYKPARSMPVFLVWLSTFAEFDLKVLYSSLVTVAAAAPRHELTARLNGSWRLGRIVQIALDGQRHLDGSWRFSDVATTLPERAIGQRDICALTTTATPGDALMRVLPRLNTMWLSLDGSWRLGPGQIIAFTGSKTKVRQSASMAGKADLQTGQAWACDYPLRPSRLGRFVSLDGSRRLGTAWRIGQVVAPWALDGRRRLGGNGLCSQAAMHPTLRAATPLATHRMGSTQRLDGRYWRLNGLRRLGRVARLNENLHLDGDRWLGLDRYAPRLGKLYHPLDGSWRVGATGCSLDGTWRIGESIAAETTFATIQ